MSKKYQILTSKIVELDKIQFDKLYKTTNGITKAKINYNNKPLLIRSPGLVLGSQIEKCGDYFYIDLVFKDKTQTKSKNNLNFLNLIREIDNLIISEIFENGKLWYPEQTIEPSLCQIESQYIPSIKLSTIYSDLHSLKLKVLNKQIEFYDNENIEIPPQLLKAGYSTTALLQLSHVYKEGEHLWADWQIIQLKTQIPDQIFKGCQLEDVEDDSEEDETIEDPDFY